MITAKYFKEIEFQRCSPPCSLQDMKQEFMDILDKVRETAGIPLIINSAHRSTQHEKKQGRTGASTHTLGCAADIKAADSRTRFLIVDAAIKLGVTRIGIAKTYIHIDTSEKHDKQVIWLY